MEFVFNLHSGPSATHVISELIIYPNLGYMCTAAETPVLDDLRMVDIFVVFKIIQAAGVSVHICRNSKPINVRIFLLLEFVWKHAKRLHAQGRVSQFYSRHEEGASVYFGHISSLLGISCFFANPYNWLGIKWVN